MGEQPALGFGRADGRAGRCASALIAGGFVALTGCSDGASAVVRPPPDPGEGGAGGDSGSDDPVPPPICEDGPVVIDPTAVIDDMEDRNGLLTAVSGRNGSWWTAIDGSTGGTFEPREPVPETIPGGRCGSRYAMRVTGQGFNEWGSMIGLSFSYRPDENGEYDTAAYDASIREGVRFWARVGDTSTRQIRFSLGDRHSTPKADWCTEGGTPACFTYEVELSRLDTSWKMYTIPFGGLVHDTPEMVAEPIDASTLYTLTFFFHASAVFDFWVDDLEFY